MKKRGLPSELAVGHTSLYFYTTQTIKIIQQISKYVVIYLDCEFFFIIILLFYEFTIIIYIKEIFNSFYINFD